MTDRWMTETPQTTIATNVTQQTELALLSPLHPQRPPSRLRAVFLTTDTDGTVFVRAMVRFASSLAQGETRQFPLFERWLRMHTPVTGTTVTANVLPDGLAWYGDLPLLTPESGESSSGTWTVLATLMNVSGTTLNYRIAALLERD